MRHWRRWLLLFSVVFFAVMNRETSSSQAAPARDPGQAATDPPQRASAP